MAVQGFSPCLTKNGVGSTVQRLPVSFSQCRPCTAGALRYRRGSPACRFVTADEVLPRICERSIHSLDVAGYVIGEVALQTAAHPGLTMSTSMSAAWSGRWDKDVVRRVIGAVPGQLDALAPHLEGTAVLEGFLWRGPCGIVVAEQ